MDSYMYLFIRQDLSPAQQIVQTAHAAAKIGDKYHGDTSIVLCGATAVDNLYEISDYLAQHEIDHALFYEPDIDECTAIATQPLQGKERHPLRKFKLLD